MVNASPLGIGKQQSFLQCRVPAVVVVPAIAGVPAVSEIPLSLPSQLQPWCPAAAAGAVAVAGDLAVVYIFAVAS